MSPAARRNTSGPARLAVPVLAGRGLPGLARAAADVLRGPVAFCDRSGVTLAVGGATRDQESRLSNSGRRVQSFELTLGGDPVGELRFIGDDVDTDLLEVTSALAALEIERVQPDDPDNEAAVAELTRGLLSGELTDGDEVKDQAAAAGCELGRGGAVILIRAYSGSAQESDWRARVLDLTVRTIRTAASGAVAGTSDAEEGVLVIVLLPATGEEQLQKVVETLDRDLPRSLPGLNVTIARSRPAEGPGEIERAVREARLALNVAEAEERSPLAFEETGAYRLLLGTTNEELHRFYAETVEPLVAYDEQYETDLVVTVETYLDSDANVPATARQMFTHRHTIRYRLERVRDLCGHDATATEGRERLGLGIKAMRVLGIAPTRRRSREPKPPV